MRKSARWRRRLASEYARGKNLPSGPCKNCPERPIQLALGRLENRWNARFYWVFAFCLMAGIGGAVLAIDKVGQRDTRWLNPLMVSGWRQGEEGASQISGACSYPTAASAFCILRHSAFAAAIDSSRRNLPQRIGSLLEYLVPFFHSAMRDSGKILDERQGLCVSHPWSARVASVPRTS